jgi:lysophospholipase L1-like esterase
MTKIILINTLVTLALVSLLEAVSRVWHPVAIPDPLISDIRESWQSTRTADPYLFWRMRENAVYKGESLTNSQGFRGPEIEPKAPGELRILSLGESTTFAIRLPYEETYSAILEQSLREYRGKPVRVINAGVPGYTLFQGVAFVELHGLSLDPDIILMYFGHNDFLPTAFRSSRDAYDQPTGAALTDRELFENRNKLPNRILLSLANHSNLVRVLIFDDGQPAARDVATTSDQTRVPEQDRIALLKKLHKLCIRNGLKLVLVVPWYLEFHRHIPLLRSFAEQENITVVDLPLEAESRSLVRADYFHDQIHPNSAGHQFIATMITKTLKEDSTN